jgi:hypothetical protein
MHEKKEKMYMELFDRSKKKELVHMHGVRTKKREKGVPE